MEYVCDSEKCTGCKVCLETCKFGALSFVDNIEATSVEIDTEKCVRCNACKKVCQGNNAIELAKPILWKQGWGEESVRNTSSSGGLASQIMKSFIESNGYVCSCSFRDGKFDYYITNREDELKQFRGSKYVKSNPDKIYSAVRKLLLKGYRVLFIGLPCHVAALKLYLHNSCEELLYTIDLICHGTPSVKILVDFLHDNNIEINNINNILFRRKNCFDLSVDYKDIVPKGVIDRYTLGFLRGLFYTENCYHCRYAQIQRVGDLTLGDSWGTNLRDQEKYGISLALCQTDKGIELLEKSKVTLLDVDLQTAIRENHQLKEPSSRPAKREVFFDEYLRQGSVKRAVFKCYPNDCLKQAIKGLLIRFHIVRGGGKQ